jgi:hypothetical protein
MSEGEFPCGESLSSDPLVSCANCGGDFLPDDMDGEHCLECADELFGVEG